jgi:hypothetical protein
MSNNPYQPPELAGSGNGGSKYRILQKWPFELAVSGLLGILVLAAAIDRFWYEVIPPQVPLERFQILGFAFATLNLAPICVLRAIMLGIQRRWMQAIANVLLGVLAFVSFLAAQVINPAAFIH